ncbi:M20 family metallopeptidase [Maribacter sp. ACAM166]|uniref:M20 family metallopeptidase n=1 Tax=Maribacter sp. ACAM166 TaxID=2508996 RepID=UPI0010FD3E66|nr:M20/M25/M40 family metallo-hydrolase [Maribacter sp. ACAM166]TLP81450.1 M20 family metallopeptidase [Maribacter sp. ACAM166]
MKNKNQLPRRKFVKTTATAMAAIPVLSVLSTTNPTNKALTYAKKHRKELIDVLEKLIRVQSIQGESAADAQHVVKEYLSKLPYRIEESDDRPSRYQDHPEYMTPNPAGDGPFVNIVGWPKKQTKQQYALFSHIDTHSIEEGWSTNPLEPKIVGNRLYGLGTSDDKGGVAAMLVAATILSKTGKSLPVVMSLHGKGGGGRGSLPVFERIRKTDHNIGAVLYVHPAETGHGLEDIKNSVQGIADLQLHMTGWRGEALEIGSIDSAEWKDGGSALDRCLELFEIFRETVFKNVSVNLGIVDGGDRIGSIADKVTITFRLKFTEPHTFKALFDDANKVINDFITSHSTSTNSYTAELKSVGYMTNPGAADWEDSKSKIVRTSIADITDHAPTAYPNHYAGDIRYPIRLLGVPAYGIGSLGGNFYMPNEWVDIDDLVKLVAVLVDTMGGWQND